MKTEIKICYFGKKRAGKSSIISHVFQGMESQDTLKIESNNESKITVYETSLLKIVNWEIPGKIENFEKLAPKEFENLKYQDIFIYVYDLREMDIDVYLKHLKSCFKILTTQNQHFFFYAFFHQSDLNFLHIVNKVEERIQIFRTKFENSLNQDGIDTRPLDQKYSKKTSIYDFTIRSGWIKSFL